MHDGKELLHSYVRPLVIIVLFTQEHICGSHYIGGTVYLFRLE